MEIKRQLRTEEMPDEVLFIVGGTQTSDDQKDAGAQTRLEDGEIIIKEHLENLGYQVVAIDEAGLEIQHIEGKSLIVISSTVKSRQVGVSLRLSAIPIVVFNGALFACLGMTRDRKGIDYGFAAHNQQVMIVAPNLPMAGDLEGTVILSKAASSGLFASPVKEASEKVKEIADNLSKKVAERIEGKAQEAAAEEVEGDDEQLIWGIPGDNAIKIAALENNQAQAVCFYYELCAEMIDLHAPARRVGLFLDQRIAAQLTAEGWTLFDIAVRWAVGDQIKQFIHIFKEEWREIQQRRSVASEARPKVNNGCRRPENLVGLALSGGGIRSATFCLGLLQGLRRRKILHAFDYLSTVSGGGYLGGWWSAWLSRLDSREKGIFPPAERIEFDRALGYILAEQGKVAEGSMNAEKDPIHHLRLFANYLTPRKGFLSADTWRAIAVITRNLVLTWLILLPIMVAFVLAGQLYSALQENFVRSGLPYRTSVAINEDEYKKAVDRLQLLRDRKFPTGEAEAARLESELLAEIKENRNFAKELRVTYKHFLLDRARRAAWLLIPLAGWLVYMVGIWLIRNTSGSKKLAWAGGLTAWLLLGVAGLNFMQDPVSKQSPSATLYTIVSRVGVGGWLLLSGWVALAGFMWFYACRRGQQFDHIIYNTPENRRQVQINRIMRVHVRLLVILVVTTAVLALGGFGHELVEYIFEPDNSLVIQAGGWTAIASAIAGSIFTAVKGSPMGGGDTRANSTPSLASRIIFAITPPLVLIVLALAAAWLARWALYSIAQNYLYSLPLLTIASFIGVILWLTFAVAEMNRRKSKLALWVSILCGSVFIISGVTAYLLVSNEYMIPVRRIWFVAIVVIATSFILLRIFVIETKDKADSKRRVFEANSNRRVFEFVIFREALKNRCVDQRQLIWLGIALASAGGLIIALLLWFTSKADPLIIERIPPNRYMLACAASTGLLLCVVLIFFEIWTGRGSNNRSRWLFFATYLVLTALLVTSFYGDYNYYSTAMLAHAAVVMLAMVFNWVVSLGWMADPNTLSLHTFYKGRLVRAYMGASNLARHERQSEITDAVEGDDVSLTDLQNCARGAPYHLINTTLNLVGGRDLTTAQRSSAAFVLSKHYCGSSRTGYRKTKKYMNGRLSLGAAVAASGAAVSPNMGSLRTSASLAMLMTLLNVRLGYWAPTPNQDNWRSSRTRLWPFYVLREFLSQTNDLSPYCYLTDGGHFENTALYSLVERGCRYIVLSDSAADPEPCFADLGNAIRRCRIDFKTEIHLDITPFIKKSKDDRFATQHYAVGRIIYSEEHVKKLGWGDNTTPQQRTGVIIYIKPALLKEEGDLTADVRQYEIENGGFPQQTTADQWFDEAQFESYRQLGYHCASLVFDKVKAGRIEAIEGYKEIDEKRRRGAELQPDEEILLAAREASYNIRSGQYLPEDIELFFEFLYAYRPK